LYTEGSEVNKGTGDGVQRWGSRRRHRFIRGFYTTIFQAEICPRLANIEKYYSCRNSEASIEALGSFQIIITYSGTAINP
jgi:hypothetical protein